MGSYDKIILTDIDEVLLKWLPTFKNFIKSHYNIDYPEDNHVGDVLGEDGFKYVHEFNHTSKHFANLHAYSDALSILPKLHNEGWKIVGVTACGTEDDVIAMRKTNLYAVFGHIFDDILTVNYTDSKLIHLNRYDTTWYIDDAWKHVFEAADIHKCIHLKRIFELDKSDPRIINANDWYDVYNIINGLVDEKYQNKSITWNVSSVNTDKEKHFIEND